MPNEITTETKLIMLLKLRTQHHKPQEKINKMMKKKIKRLQIKQNKVLIMTKIKYQPLKIIIDNLP